MSVELAIVLGVFVAGASAVSIVIVDWARSMDSRLDEAQAKLVEHLENPKNLRPVKQNGRSRGEMTSEDQSRVITKIAGVLVGLSPSFVPVVLGLVPVALATITVIVAVLATT